ncbi:MAG: T9SS type A sorting domain-containing protein [Crocinitomicaceae bacterium]
MILKLLTFSFLLFEVFSFGQQWEQRANTPFTKDHGIGFSLNGFGYVLTGGANGQVFTETKDFFKYDPVTDTWEQLPDYPGPNRGYGIGDTYDGKLYFGFGTDGFSFLNDLWEWDPATGIFTELPSCPCIGRVHPGLIADNGKVFMGAGGASGNLNDWWEYDISSQNWTQKTSIPGPRHHPYQFAIDGDIYMGAGHLTTWYKFDVANNTWTQIASLSPARVAGAQFSYNGKGYALSGTDEDHNRFTTGQFREYDPIANTWTNLPDHPGTSRFAPTQFLIDDYIYLLGGYFRLNNSVSPETTMYRYQMGAVSTANIDENGGELVGSVYPNPATNELNIKLSQELSPNALINVYNLTGKLILSAPFVQQLDISELTSGMYVIDLIDEGANILREKITKM